MIFSLLLALPSFPLQSRKETVHKTEAIDNILKPYNDYFLCLKNLDASLSQTNEKGQEIRAKLYLGSRRLRLIYPSFELRAKDKKLIHFDKRTKEKEELIIENTPLFFLFFKKKIQDIAYVDKIEHRQGHVFLLLRNKKDPQSGTLTLIFKKKPVALIGWILEDEHYKKTFVAFQSASYNAKQFNEKIFIDPS